jgi:hypothetical protein
MITSIRLPLRVASEMPCGDRRQPGHGPRKDADFSDKIMHQEQCG